MPMVGKVVDDVKRAASASWSSDVCRPRQANVIAAAANQAGDDDGVAAFGGGWSTSASWWPMHGERVSLSKLEDVDDGGRGRRLEVCPDHRDPRWRAPGWWPRRRSSPIRRPTRRKIIFIVINAEVAILDPELTSARSPKLTAATDGNRHGRLRRSVSRPPHHPLCGLVSLARPVAVRRPPRGCQEGHGHRRTRAHADGFTTGGDGLRARSARSTRRPSRPVTTRITGRSTASSTPTW